MNETNGVNNRESLMSKEGALWLLMFFATLIIGVVFYLSERFVSQKAAIVISSVTLGILIVAWILFSKTKWMPLASVFTLSSLIGVSISIFYMKFTIPTSSFYLTIIINLLFLAVLLFMKMQIANKKTVKRLLVFIIILEIILAVALAIISFQKMNILWGVFFGELNVIYMTSSILVLLSETKETNKLLREIAMCFLLGYICIIVIVVAIVLSLVAEDGSPFEMVGEILTGIVDADGKKKKPPIKPI